MFLARLGALARDDPKPIGEIDLTPLSADHFAGSCGGQDQEFQGSSGNTVLRTQRRHEFADLSIWQRCMVLDATHLRSRRQQIVEVTVPLCWVFTLAMPRALAQSKIDSIRPRSLLAVSGFSVQIGSSTLSTSRYRSIAPAGTDNGISIGDKCRAPLGGMFGVAPSGPMRLDVTVAGF